MDENCWDVVGDPHYNDEYDEGKVAGFTLPKDKIWLLEGDK
jgi:hypothetical protein